MTNLWKYTILTLGIIFVNSLLPAYSQSVTIYCFPPPHKINWTSPHTLLWSTFRNYISKKNDQPLRPLGHIMVELKNDSSYILTGMAPKKKSDLKRNVLKDKEGLGILFQVIEGHLEETDIVRSELHERLQSGKAAFITYRISDSAFEYLKLYVKAYKERGYDRLYNGKNLPRMGEGSGCSAFAMSFLELINALSPELHNNWTIKVNVPDKLIGGRYADSKISLLKLLFSFRWAGKNEPSTPLELYDPYLMYNWIKAKWAVENVTPVSNYAVKNSGNAKGLEVHCPGCFPQLPMFTCDTLKNNSARR